MKFLHTGDLHIGKRVNEFSMLEDQRHILGQIREAAIHEKVDVLVIAGDIYDRPIPSTEAVELLDSFLTAVLDEKISVVMISGNHDSPQRVAFAERILDKQGLFIAGGYDGELKRVVFADEYGSVEFVCLPFVKPSQAGAATSAQAVEHILSSCPMHMDGGRRRILVTHYFVTGENGEEPELSDSETTVHVGGLDNVQASLFESFDYVALGHIHRSQQIGAGQVHYAGAPLKYSFSEAGSAKYVNIVTVKVKGEVEVQKKALVPLHEMRVLKGRLEELMDAGRGEGSGERDTEGAEAGPQEIQRAAAPPREDYIQAILTDTEELIDPIGTLRSIYPNTMQIILEKNREGAAAEYQSNAMLRHKTIEELFSGFYEMLKGEPLDDKRFEIVRKAAEETRSGKGMEL